MKDQTTLAILQRRWPVIVATVLVFVVVAGVVSRVLPKVYAATSTLIVVQNKNAASFEAVQAAEVTARSYADIVSAPVIAGIVASRLGEPGASNSVSSSISVSPVIETQLLHVTAESRNPHYAQRLANLYASVVIEYVHGNLGTTAGASIALASPATLPTSPARPRPTLYMFIGALIGLFVGVGGAFVLERLDTRLRTADELRTRFQQVILARIPRRGPTIASGRAFDEAFGLLRTNLQYASPGGFPKVIAVASAREGEGKTTCVANMGFAMAEAGLLVTLVDADFRRSRLSAKVMSEASLNLRPGLADYIVHACSLSEAVHQTGRPSVQLVPTGNPPSNPAAFLEAHPIRPTLEELAERSDVVLVDLPPLSAGADASIVAARADGVIMVVNLGLANERVVADMLRQMEIVRAPMLGFIVNEDRAIDFAYDYEPAVQTSR